MSSLALPSTSDIRRYAQGALAAADAKDTTPAPLGDIAEAAGLLPPEELYTLGNDAPPHILNIAKKLRGRVMGLLATRERTIYLDKSQPSGKQRFTYGHEIGHSVLPWHEGAYLGDDQYTLSPATTEVLEQEANAFSSEILFGIDRFTEQADSYAPGVGVPLSLADTYAASRHASLRRYVSFSRRNLGLLVLGRYTVSMNGQAALKVIPAQCVQSLGFEERFGTVADTAPQRFALDANPAVSVAANLYCEASTETTSLRLDDTKRGPVEFDAEVFDNGRLRFVLLFQRRFGQGTHLRIATN